MVLHGAGQWRAGEGVYDETCAVSCEDGHNILVISLWNDIQFHVHFRAAAMVSASHSVLLIVFFSSSVSEAFLCVWLISNLEPIKQSYSDTVENVQFCVHWIWR